MWALYFNGRGRFLERYVEAPDLLMETPVNVNDKVGCAYVVALVIFKHEKQLRFI